MASITARTNKKGEPSYRVEVRMKGHPPQTATFKRKTDAKAWAADTESAIRENRHFKNAEAKKKTFGQMIDRYLVEILPTKPKAQSQVHQLTWFKSRLGHYTLFDISTAKLVECRQALLSEPTGVKLDRQRTPATVNRYLAALSHAYTVAVNDWEWMDESPMRKVKKLPEPRGRVRFLSDDTMQDGKTIAGERTRLLDACHQVRSSDYLYPIVVLALSTAMRLNEIRKLTWSAVDLDAGRITLYETKNGEIRVLPLVGRSHELLVELAASSTHNPNALLFPSPVNPTIPFDITSGWRSAVQKAELEDFRFHDLRHSAASYLAMNGATPNEIAEILGHKTLQMVKRYSHLSESHTASVVESMNRKIFG